MNDEATEKFRILLASLMGEESHLHLMGDAQLTPDMIPEQIFKQERAILQALFDCDARGIVPIPENVKLMANKSGHKLIDEVAALTPKPIMIRALAIWVRSVVYAWYLDQGWQKASKIAKGSFIDAEEQRDLMMDAIMGALPSSVNASRFSDLQLAERMMEIQIKRVERRKNKQALGSVMPFVGLREFVPALSDGDVTLLSAASKAGKAQPLDAKIMTPSGWKSMGDIRIGDVVSNPDGSTSNVVGIYPQGKKEIYRVTFSDGSQTECCNDHLWSVHDVYDKQPILHVFSLSHLRSRLKASNGGNRWRIPVTKPVEFCKNNNLPVDPYLLGVLIGDGCLKTSTPSLSTEDDEIVTWVNELLPKNMSLKKRAGDNYDYGISQDKFKNDGRVRLKSELVMALEKLSLMGEDAYNKHIPSEYLMSSIEDRIALLQGLLDTDGCPAKRGDAVEYATSSVQLAKDVKQLVQSLGGVARVTPRQPWYTHKSKRIQGAISYRIMMSFQNGFQPFRLKRKTELYHGRKSKPLRRAIASIELVGEKEAQCIKVDNPNELYITDDYIVTHNTTIAAEFARYNTEQNDSDVLWLLTETSPEQIEQRRLASKLLIPTKHLVTGAVDLREEPFLSMHNAYLQERQDTWVNKGRLYLEYIAGLPASSLVSIVHRYAMMAKKRNRPLLVMIDYLQRIPATGGKSDTEALARISNDIKTMAVTENVHVLLLSQETFNSEKGNTHGSRTPIMISQVHISVERKPAMTTIYVEDGEGNIKKNAVGQDRLWQITGSQYSHQSIMKLEVLRANNDQPGTCFVAVENPLFIIEDISGVHRSRLLPFMRQQIESFESD